MRGAILALIAAALLLGACGDSAELRELRSALATLQATASVAEPTPTATSMPAATPIAEPTFTPEPTPTRTLEAAPAQPTPVVEREPTPTPSVSIALSLACGEHFFRVSQPISAASGIGPQGFASIPDVCKSPDVAPIYAGMVTVYGDDLASLCVAAAQQLALLGPSPTYGTLLQDTWGRYLRAFMEAHCE